jgi:hypothetical protein
VAGTGRVKFLQSEMCALRKLLFLTNDPKWKVQMNRQQKEIQGKIDLLNANEKLTVVNYILENLDKPDPKIDQEWIKESKSRLKAMKSGKMKVYQYKDEIGKYL